jgi:hypothetical protein
MLCSAYDDMAIFSYYNTRGVTALPPLRNLNPKFKALELSNGKGNVSRKHISSLFIKQVGVFTLPSLKGTSHNLERKL